MMQIFRQTLVATIRGRAMSSYPALNFVSGKKVVPSGSDTSQDFEVVNPATGQLIYTVASSGSSDVDHAVQSAKTAFKTLKEISPFERGKMMIEAARKVRENLEAFAQQEVVDTGKPIWEARFDIDGCAASMEYYGGLAAAIAGEHYPLSNGSFGYTRREPLGVVGAIGAWNYPFQMAAWKSAPAMVCGNTIVIKPAPWTPHTTFMLGEIYEQAGFPTGSYNVIQGLGETGTLLSLHPDVAKMSFTGSVATGSKVMENCAKGIKHVTLELGGKSPLLIFDDCSMDNAVKGAMLANFMSNGQVCSNGTRVFVQRSILEPFLEKLVARTVAMKIGNPLHDDTLIGATHKSHAEKVLNYIEKGKQEGAKILCGGERVALVDSDLSAGCYLSPCVFTDCHDDMTIVKEEIFGGVMSVLPFDSEEEAIYRANNTHFGLAGGVFTKDLSRAHRVIAELEAGSCYINNYHMIPVEIPFGGFKQSGIGRESGQVTLNYYTQVKGVYVELNDIDCPY